MNKEDFKKNFNLAENILLVDILDGEAHILAINDCVEDGAIITEPSGCYIDKNTVFYNLFDYIAEHSCYLSEEDKLDGTNETVFETLSSANDIKAFLIVDKYDSWDDILHLPNGLYILGIAGNSGGMQKLLSESGVMVPQKKGA